VDATYSQRRRHYTVIAAAVRSGVTSIGWQLVARGAVKIGQLKGKRVLVPGVGARERLRAQRAPRR